MTLFYLLLQASWFDQTAHPTLTASWDKRSFTPCRALCAQLGPAAREFATRYAQADDPPLVCRLADGMPFRRELWAQLVGEVLIHGAAEIVQIEAEPDTLCRLLAGLPWNEEAPRESFGPIQQVLFGARDLRFGGKFYRPHRAGWNSRADVSRLAEYLAVVNVDQWGSGQLGDAETDGVCDDLREELEFARQALDDLRQLYERAQLREYVMVRETW